MIQVAPMKEIIPINEGRNRRRRRQVRERRTRTRAHSTDVLNSIFIGIGNDVEQLVHDPEIPQEIKDRVRFLRGIKSRMENLYNER